MQSITNKIKAMQSEQKPVKLHLGCGKRFLSGFFHVDIDSYPHVELVSNVADLSSIPSCSVDLIYASHVLGYFDFLEVELVLLEWYRVLKKGAVLRVSVPNFDKVIEVYQKYDDMKLLYGFLYGRYIRSESDKKLIYHRMIFTFKTLKEYLIKAGFESIKPYEWQETIHKDYDDYSQAYIPHLQKDTGLLMSINVEALK